MWGLNVKETQRALGGVAYLWRFTVRLWINLWISLEPAPVPPIPSPPPMLGLQLIGDAFTSSRLR